MLHRTPCSLHGRRWASLRPLCRHRPRHRHHQPLKAPKRSPWVVDTPKGVDGPPAVVIVIACIVPTYRPHRLHRTLPIMDHDIIIALMAFPGPTMALPGPTSSLPPWLIDNGHSTRKSRMPEAIQRSSDAEKSNARSDPNAIRQSSKPIHHAAAHHTLGIGRAIDREEYGTSPYRCLTVRTIDQNGIRYATVKAV